MARRALAVLAVFAASGAMHEAAWVCLTGRPTPRLAWLCFFCLQGPLVILEKAACSLRSNLPSFEIPCWVSVILTAAILELLAGLLFWLPPEASGMAEAVIRDAVSPLSW